LEAVTWGDDCDARWPGALPLRANRPHASFAPSDGPEYESDSARNSGGGDRTRILYFNPTFVANKYVEMMRQGRHDVVATNRPADALAMMRGQCFDALVMDCAQDAVDILNFTVKAHGLQPSLAVFLADEWGDDLATGLEELTHVLTMLEDDEFARLEVESLMA
jgi:hypothetical protein